MLETSYLPTGRTGEVVPDVLVNEVPFARRAWRTRAAREFPVAVPGGALIRNRPDAGMLNERIERVFLLIRLPFQCSLHRE
jgi:hypothetical protein